MGYTEAWAYQTAVHRSLVARKKARGWSKAPTEPPHRLLFVEHPPVYTLGKSGSLGHLLLDESQLAEAGIEFHKINRGGDITFHGPGQLVGYPILDLDWFFHDVRRYVSALEQSVIDLLADYRVEATRFEGFTGVWLPPKHVGHRGLPWRKICAIGVHLSRWVTLHGFAFNVNTDLAYFDHIVPCGIGDADKAVTSLAAEFGETVNLTEVKRKLRGKLAQNLGWREVADFN